MNNFYTFIVLSTINTTFGAFTPEERFNQTLRTLESIKEKIPNVKIVFIDNSTEPLKPEWKWAIAKEVNVFHQFKHNICTRYFNNIGAKGTGEICLMEKAMELIREHKLIGKRIFKISGRYFLRDSFDINEYDKAEGKYVFRVNMWDVSKDNWITKERVIYFETRLWSLCHTLFDEYESMIQTIFTYMVDVEHNLEKSLFRLIPHEKLYELNEMHLEGWTADTGIIKIE